MKRILLTLLAAGFAATLLVYESFDLSPASHKSAANAAAAPTYDYQTMHWTPSPSPTPVVQSDVPSALQPIKDVTTIVQGTTSLIEVGEFLTVAAIVGFFLIVGLLGIIILLLARKSISPVVRKL